MRRGLEAEALDALFPFYVAFGADLRIQQLGPLLRLRYPDLRLGSLLPEHFRQLVVQARNFIVDVLVNGLSLVNTFRVQTLSSPSVESTCVRKNGG